MSLSLDLDNKWSYLKTHGSDEWQEFPSYLDVAVPRILKFLGDRDLTITFFIVGQDAALSKNRDAIIQIKEAGHEIASHSFNHDPWLHLYDKDQLNAELEEAEIAIERVTGVRVKGFRGPGFSLSPNTIRVLSERGYAYDATVFPNILNPLARAYFFARSNLSKEQKKRRKALFGTLSDALRPIEPFAWEFDEQRLTELPVTTMPVFRTPIHFSYLIYLGGFSSTLAKVYLRMAVQLCSICKTEPSLLLHPLDFLGCEDDKELNFFPGMDQESDMKQALLSDFMAILSRKFAPTTVGDFVSTLQPERMKLKPLPVGL